MHNARCTMQDAKRFEARAVYAISGRNASASRAVCALCICALCIPPPRSRRPMRRPLKWHAADLAADLGQHIMQVRAGRLELVSIDHQWRTEDDERGAV